MEHTPASMIPRQAVKAVVPSKRASAVQIRDLSRHLDRLYADLRRAINHPNPAHSAVKSGRLIDQIKRTRERLDILVRRT